MRKMSRTEASKEARRVLNRNGVDLGYCQYAVSGMEVRLTGWLCKHDGSDFNGSQIETMIQEFTRVLAGFSIAGDLDNWRFTSDHISFVGEKESKSGGGGFEDEQERYEIDIDYEAS